MPTENEKPAVTAQDAPPADSNPANEIPEWMNDPVKAKAEIQKVRAEAAETRKKLRELETLQTQREQEIRSAEEAKLKETQQYKELYERTASDYEKLKPELERAAALEAAVRETLNAELADVPEDLRALVPAGDVTAQLAWVRNAKKAGLFKKPSAPNLDAGVRGEVGKKPVDRKQVLGRRNY